MATEEVRSVTTQAKAILAHLQRGRTLTSLNALRLFGTLRLAARIHALRSAGHDIKSGRVQVGEKRIASYWI